MILIFTKAWFWHTNLKNKLMFVIAIIFTLFAIIIFIGELTIFINTKFSLLGELHKYIFSGVTFYNS